MSKTPAVGDKATYYPSIHNTADREPKDATVTKVWTPECVNLQYTLLGGAPCEVTSVRVVSEPAEGGYCCVLA